MIPAVGRLILDEAKDGAWNMSVDELMLEQATHHQQLTLRFYTWNAPTLSLGYFQSFRERKVHPASLRCPCVRRSSGGGAILHDRELTYSIAVPDLARSRTHAARLYATLHGTLVQSLVSFGIQANTCAASEPRQSVQFLCFQRLTPGDVLIQGMKVAGSAQRRSASAVLQHGSVLLGQSTFSPELPGITELSGRSVTSNGIREAWLAQLTREWSVDWQAESLGPTELEQAARWRQLRFQNRTWTERR